MRNFSIFLLAYFIYVLFNNVVLCLVGRFWGFHFNFQWMGTACDLYSTNQISDTTFQVSLYSFYAAARVLTYSLCLFLASKYQKITLLKMLIGFAGYEIMMVPIFLLSSTLFRLYLSNTPLFLLGLHLDIWVVLLPIFSAVLFGLAAFQALSSQKIETRWINK